MNMKFLMLVPAVVALAMSAPAKTIYISPTGSGNKDGTSADNAATLALLRSNFGSWFVTGEKNVVQLLDSDTPYDCPATSDTAVFDFNNGNTKYVVFQGNVDDPSKVTINLAPFTKGGRVYVVRAPGELRGITFKDYKQADGAYPGVVCAFVAFASGKFVVEDCCFENCKTSSTNANGEESSGAVVRHYNQDKAASTSELIMSNCVFKSCSSYQKGIIFKKYAGGKMELSGCTFEDCSTATGTGALVYWNAAGSDTCGLTMKDCVARNLTCTGTPNTDTCGGAICLIKGNLTLEGCAFDTVSGAYNGGCVFVYNGAANLSIDRCIFRNCTCVNAAGAIFTKQTSGTLTVRNTLFTGCGVKTKNSGGSCIRTAGTTTVAIDNCTFADNCSSDGTASSNVSPLDANSANAKNYVSNCVFWNNKDGGGNLRVTSNTGNTIFANCVSDLSGQGDTVALLTSTPFVGGGDYSLVSSAVDCIDSGAALDWMTGAKDLAGNDRVINGLPDLGAYEFGAVSALPGIMIIIE